MSSITQCLKYFPVSLFASVMEVSGLSIAYQRYAHVFAAPPWMGIGLLALASGLFICISLIYAAKFFHYRDEVTAEFKHPVRANFFSAISISLLLLSIAYLNTQATLSQWLWSIGSILHLIMTLVIVSRWIVQNYDLSHANPAWFIPVVGNILVPIAGVEFVHRELLWFFFSTGLFFWLALFAIVFYRIIFHHQLTQKFMPTLFVLIAPPAVGFVSYIKLTGGMDSLARLLLYIALFFTLLLASMFPHFSRLRYFVSWWAYTFPLCAVTIASILAYNQRHLAAFAWISTVLLVVSTFAVTLVFIKTLLAIQKQTLCEPEE